MLVEGHVGGRESLFLPYCIESFKMFREIPLLFATPHFFPLEPFQFTCNTHTRQSNWLSLISWLIPNANFFRGRSSFTGNHNQMIRCSWVQERNMIKRRYLLLFVSRNVNLGIERLVLLTVRLNLSPGIARNAGFFLFWRFACPDIGKRSMSMRVLSRFASYSDFIEIFILRWLKSVKTLNSEKYYVPEIKIQRETDVELWLRRIVQIITNRYLTVSSKLPFHKLAKVTMK